MSANATNDWLLDAVGGRVREFYSEMGVELPGQSTGKNISVRCFTNAAGHQHGDRNASCSIDALTGQWKCFACNQAGNPYQAAIALGYTSQRAHELAKQYGLWLEVEKPDRPRLPTERQLTAWRNRLLGSPKILARLWELKGWTPRAIVRCGIGWDGQRLTFPIRDKRLARAGLVRYLPGGKPKTIALPGSKRLLFPAPEVLSRKRPLFLVEGEPAAVSIRSCGHQATAIPGVNGWRLDFAQRLAGFKLIILPDCDRQGRDLADRMSGMLPSARLVDVWPSREDGWDIADEIALAAQQGGLGQMRRLLEAVAV